MELEVLNIMTGKAIKQVKLNDAIFSAIPNDNAIYLDVKHILANRRQGTHKTKQRNEIAGSTKKLKKQKGTGGARAGSIKSPLFKGGGRVFGPQPRDYSFKLNKKVKKIARVSALSYKAKNNQIILLEDFSIEAPNTKRYIELLNNINMATKKTLLVLSKEDKNLYLSSRNLKKSKVIVANNINTYDLLNNNYLLMTETSLPVVEKLLSK